MGVIGKIANIIFGGAMVALKCIINPGSLADGAVRIANEVLDCHSEFIGDGVQGLSGSIADAIKRRREKKREMKEVKALFANEGLDKLDDIFNELKEYDSSKNSDTKRTGSLGGFFRNHFGHKDKNNPQNYLIQLAQRGLSEEELCKYMDENSATFKDLDEEKKEVLGIAVHSTMKAIITERWNKIGSYEDQTMAAFLSYFISDRTDRIADEIKEIKQIITAIAQNNGEISLQEVTICTDPLKYQIRTCPVCGYNGYRLFVDNNRDIHCAACGKVTEIVKIDQADVCKKIDELSNRLTIQINHMSEVAATTTDNNQQVARQLDTQYDAMREVTATVSESSQQTSQRLDDLTKAFKEFQTSFHSEQISEEVINQISTGVKRMIDAEYLDRCINGCTEADAALTNDDAEKIFAAYMEQINKQVKVNVGTSSDAIIDILKEHNKELQENNKTVNEKLNSLDRQIKEVFNVTALQLDGLHEINSEMLAHIKLACTREYMEQRMQSLGSEISSTVVGKISERSQALAEDSIKRIFVRLNDVIEHLNEIQSQMPTGNSNGNEEKNEIIDKQCSYLKEQNYKLHITMKQTLEILQNHSKESAKQLQLIISSQDVILKNILSLNINGVKTSGGYGRIPTEYLLNEGFDHIPFECPFCGVKEARQMNADQYCYCSVCNNKYIPIKKEKQSYLGEAKKIEDRVSEWRERHTPVFYKAGTQLKKDIIYLIYEAKTTLERGCDCKYDNIMIIPDIDYEEENIKYICQIIETNDILNSIKTLLLGSNIEYISLKSTDVFTSLNTIVFYGNYNLKIIGQSFMKFREKYNKNEAKLFGNLSSSQKNRWKNYEKKSEK